MPTALRRTVLLLVAALLPLAAVPGPVAVAGGQPVRGAYLALGDSYSSGVGAERRPEGPCGRSDGAYGPRFAQSPAGARYLLALHACSGAETRHVVSEAQADAGEAEPQVNRLGAARQLALVTITVGGNDARFSEIASYCATGFRSCTVRYGPGGRYGDQSEWLETQVRPRLVETYRRLGRAAGDARVLVLTYPQIFQEHRECRRDWGINGGEKRWIREQTTRLNDVIRKEAPRFGLDVLDVEDAFAGHEICTADPYAAGIGEPGTFHPNAKGYEVLSRRLAAAVR